MELTRRELLKLGGAGTVAAMMPSLGAQSSTAPQSAPAPTLDQKYLEHGLDLLCSAHSTDAFFGGHAGGAVIAAYYLCREGDLEAGTSEVIQTALDRHYTIKPDPFPDEKPAKDGVSGLLQSMEDGIDELCRDGHNVIFLSLVLRAFQDVPEAVTPARIEGIRKTIKALEPRRKGAGDIEIPESTSSYSEFVLEEFLASTEGGPGQGFSGHILTYGRAILDLRTLGHEAFAQKCLNAFKLAVKNARPRSPGKGYREDRKRVEFVRPTSKAYWDRRVAAGTMELGHLFKYPYGFFGLRRQSKNPELNTVCLDNSYRLFAS